MTKAPATNAVAARRTPGALGESESQGNAGGRATGTSSRAARLALAGLASLFVALSLYVTLSSEPGRYVPDDRLEQVIAPTQDLARNAHLWDDSRSLGRPRGEFTPVTAGFQAAVSAFVGRAWLVERFTHALYLSLAAVGVILLMAAFWPKIGLEHAVAAFAYTFSPFTTQFLLPSPYFLCYALAPWFAWIALRGVRDGDPWRWAAAFALAIVPVFTVNAATLGFALLPAALTALYFSVFEHRGLGRLWGWTWRAGLLSVLTCAAGIVVLWFSAPEVSANLRTTELPETLARTSSWSESWRGLGQWLIYAPTLFVGARSSVDDYFTQVVVIGATFVAPVGALLALARTRWRHRLLFGSMLLISLLLMVGLHEVEGPSPIARLLSFAFDHSQVALGFRNTYKAGAGLMLAIAILLGLGVGSAVRSAAQPRRNAHRRWPVWSRLRPMALGVGLPVIMTVALLLASFPFWTGRIYADDGFRNIPGYWARTFNFLDAQAPGRVLLLPGSNLANYRWGHAQDGLFDGLSPLSPMVNRFLPQGTRQTADLVSAIDQYVSSPGYEPGTLGPILRRIGVQWVLVQNDLNWQQMQVPRPSTYNALLADPSLRLTAVFGRPGQNTTRPGDLGGALLGERKLPPVEIFRVRGAQSPQPRLSPSPPLLVEGAGDSWPALATAGLLHGPPVAYTGAATDDVLRSMLRSGSQVVVTDGNRRRATIAGTGRPSQSATLAASEPLERTPDDLFGSSQTQSLATYTDGAWISASRYGFLNPYVENGSRPASAFDGIERTAWTVRGPLRPDGESVTVKLRRPTTVTGVSVMPLTDGPWRIRAVDVVLRSEDGTQTSKRLLFSPTLPERTRARIEATRVSEIELRIARISGPGPVGLAGVGIAEAGVSTPSGPLDLREFVRTPDDLAARAAQDSRLRSLLAVRPPRYVLRRVIGTAGTDEETELRREITTFGHQRYRLSATARIDNRSADSAIAGLLGATVAAMGTSHFGGPFDGRGGLAVDNDLATGWQPEPRVGERLDVHFPSTEVSRVELLTLSGTVDGAVRSRVARAEITVGDGGVESARSVGPWARRCLPGTSPPEACLERHVFQVPLTRTDQLSVRLTGIEPARTRLGPAPPEVVEVRVNGRDWTGTDVQPPPDTCAPLFRIDGNPILVRLPRDPVALFSSRVIDLKGCRGIELSPGPHRIESTPGLSGAVLTTSLVPLGESTPPPATAPRGKVRILDRSVTQLHMRVTAPRGALLVGGMPFHRGWVMDSAHLERTALPLDTFSAWRVDEPIAEPVTLDFKPQKLYELAIAVSIAAAAWCLWRITRRPKRLD